MDKLHVFSKKLGKAMEVSFQEDGTLVTPEGVPVNGDGIVFSWNNSSGSWIDKGWTNSGGNWQDQGWCNSGGHWIDKGWSNSGGTWIDKGWSNSGGNWADGGGGGGGCFITTACVEFQGLRDDCAEMQTLRKYRDVLVKEDETFRSKVLEYYRKAPLIIQEIEKSGHASAVYQQLYHNMIQPCVAYLDAGHTEEAKELYLRYYESLVKEYLES
ncbi:MAG TPA: hypothetical protein IAA45_07195 [Candidatus Blautia gallistercoris]|uniref:Uncharacterized protein n=1 Tax=Candidatus Blautia gallistercoris TaxID=2838490 RepID=A0A9D1WHS6_9FIRM|nr:hypothetical protein [Candidatus Blautia gallistercoris]